MPVEVLGLAVLVQVAAEGEGEARPGLSREPPADMLAVPVGEGEVACLRVVAAVRMVSPDVYSDPRSKGQLDVGVIPSSGSVSHTQ